MPSMFAFTYKINAKPYQSVIAVSSACLIMLVLSISFPFMSFSVQGLSQEITLLHAAKMLAEFQNALLGALLLATVVVLPAIYVGLILFLHLEALKFATIRRLKAAAYGQNTLPNSVSS